MREGISVRHFLPAGVGTIQSLGTLITGLPYTKQDISSSVKAFPTSLALQFKRLGFKTNLFYGGDAAWLNLKRFSINQGFDEIYSADQMADKTLVNAWGVQDEYLFDFIFNKIDNSHPTFNFIMTTSYHPPYSVDVYKKGFHLQSIPQDLASIADKNVVDLKALGHLWYADQCLGTFVRRAESRFDNALFVITGDHSSRRFISARPTYFEKSAVPFVMYGKTVLSTVKLPRDISGSHLDIGPTLIELSAPRGFRYYAVGTSLLNGDHSHIGIGWHRVIGRDFLLDLSSPAKLYPLPDIHVPDGKPDIGEMNLLFNRVYSIGWWRVVRGSRLE
jgi:phosphoglycerol transferase MdoB-like AlkP superfamily enzyme